MFTGIERSSQTLQRRIGCNGITYCALYIKMPEHETHATELPLRACLLHMGNGERSHTWGIYSPSMTAMIYLPRIHLAKEEIVLFFLWSELLLTPPGCCWPPMAAEVHVPGAEQAASQGLHTSSKLLFLAEVLPNGEGVVG